MTENQKQTYPAYFREKDCVIACRLFKWRWIRNKRTGKHRICAPSVRETLMKQEPDAWEDCEGEGFKSPKRTGPAHNTADVPYYHGDANAFLILCARLKLARVEWNLHHGVDGDCKVTIMDGNPHEADYEAEEKNMVAAMAKAVTRACEMRYIG